MKTISKTGLLITLFAALAILITSCQYRNEKKSESSEMDEKTELEEMREDIISKYEVLKNDIDKSIERIDKRMEDASGEEEERLEDAKEELLNERSKLEKAMVNIEDASKDTWSEVNAFAENTYTLVKDGVEETAQDIEKWFEGSDESSQSQ